MLAEPGKLIPGEAAVHRPEEGGVFPPGVHGVRIFQRGFQMPDSRELPRMLRAVVPLVSPRDTVVHELVAYRLPRRATVIRPLDRLSEPTAGLRRVQPIGLDR